MLILSYHFALTGVSPTPRLSSKAFVSRFSSSAFNCTHSSIEICPLSSIKSSSDPALAGPASEEQITINTAAFIPHQTHPCLMCPPHHHCALASCSIPFSNNLCDAVFIKAG